MPIPQPRDRRALHGRLLSTGPMDVRVRDFMTSAAITLDAGASVRHAYDAMVTHGVHAVLVVDSHGTTVGWITARGLMTSIARYDDSATARDAITDPVVAISPAATAADALRGLCATRAGHLVVRRNDSSPPEGVVGELDLIALMRS